MVRCTIADATSRIARSTARALGAARSHAPVAPHRGGDPANGTSSPPNFASRHSAGSGSRRPARPEAEALRDLAALLGGWHVEEVEAVYF
jgi:hypothetical protein